MSKISKVLIRDYLIAFNNSIPSHLRNYTDHRLSGMLWFKNQEYMLQRIGLKQFLENYNIKIHVHSDTNNSLFRDNDKNDNVWRPLILPWLAIATNFNWQLIKSGIDAAFTERGATPIRRSALVTSFLNDFLVNYTVFPENRGFNADIINDVFSQFDEDNLLQYRRLLLSKAEEYNTDNQYDFLRYATQIKSLNEIFNKNEVQIIKNKLLCCLSEIKDYYPRHIKDILQAVINLPGEYDKATLDVLKNFVLTKVKYKRVDLPTCVDIATIINNVLQEHNYTHPEIDKIISRKFIHALSRN